MLVATIIKFSLQFMAKMKSCWKVIQRGKNTDKTDNGTHMFHWSLSTKM